MGILENLIYTFTMFAAIHMVFKIILWVVESDGFTVPEVLDNVKKSEYTQYYVYVTYGGTCFWLLLAALVEIWT